MSWRKSNCNIVVTKPSHVTWLKNIFMYQSQYNNLWPKIKSSGSSTLVKNLWSKILSFKLFTLASIKSLSKYYNIESEFISKNMESSKISSYLFVILLNITFLNLVVPIASQKAVVESKIWQNKFYYTSLFTSLLNAIIPH